MELTPMPTETQAALLREIDERIALVTKAIVASATRLGYSPQAIQRAVLEDARRQGLILESARVRQGVCRFLLTIGPGESPLGAYRSRDGV